MEKYRKYSYSGPVLVFGKVFDKEWKGETMAPSESKARSNLKYQFTKSHNRVASTSVSLPAKIVEVG